MTQNSQASRNKCRILIVDDHPIVRRGLRELVADEPDLEVCGEAEDVAQALDQVASSRPDLVIIDLTLKGGHGLDLIQEVRARHGQVKMLVSSMRPTRPEMLAWTRAPRAPSGGVATH